MKTLVQTDYKPIIDLARKYGIVVEDIKISVISNTESVFLVKLEEKTSAFEFITFQSELSKLLGDEGEEIDVVTEQILNKRVRQYQITENEKTQLINKAQFLAEHLNSTLVPTKKETTEVEKEQQIKIAKNNFLALLEGLSDEEKIAEILDLAQKSHVYMQPVPNQISSPSFTKVQ